MRLIVACTHADFASARRREARPRLVGPDQRAATIGVLLRQEPVQGLGLELRVAVQRLAIGEDELQRFGDMVHVLRRVVPHAEQVELLHQVERLPKRGALAPEAAGVHLQFAVGTAHRLLELHLERCHVLQGEQPAMRPVEVGDRTGQVAAVETVARGLQALQAASPARPRGAFLVHHVPQARRQVSLDEQLAHLGHLTPGQVHRRVRRPAFDLGPRRLQLLAHEGVHDEAFASETLGEVRNIAEGERAEPTQRLDVRRRRCGHDGAQQTFRDLAAVLCLEQLARGLGGPHAYAIDRDRLLLVRQPDDHRRDTGDVDLVAVHHGEHECSGDTGIHGIAARLEHLERRLGSEVVARAHAVLARGYDGAPRGEGTRHRCAGLGNGID